jgi:hypothetical protein
MASHSKIFKYLLKSPGRVKRQEFSCLLVVQTGSVVRPASYPMGTGALSPEVKRPGREADHSPPASAEVKKMWFLHPLPHTPSWRTA